MLSLDCSSTGKWIEYKLIQKKNKALSFCENLYDSV